MLKLWPTKKEASSSAPQVKDFPKGAYSAYWEIIPSDVEGGYRAEVRVMGWEGVHLREQEVFTSPSKTSLDNQVSQFIRDAMERNKRA